MADETIAVVAVLETAVAFIGSVMSLEVLPAQETVSVRDCHSA
jgi:hypothetical protein